MNKLSKLTTFAAAASMAFSVNAFATVYAEVPDAGQALGSAQALAGGTHQVTGSVSGDADLFSFFWGGGAFYASTVGSSGDTQLFLFNSAGAGVLGNDDGIAYAGPAYVSTGSLAAGQYYIGVSAYDYDPYSSGGLMFPTYPYGPVYGPNNSDPLSYWSGGSYSSSSYSINFQQITSNGTPVGDPTPVGNVPEPVSLALLGLGLAGLAVARRRKQA